MGEFIQSSVARLDVHLTGDQEIAGSNPTGLATFFCGDLIIETFPMVFLPGDLRRTVVNSWLKNMTILVNCLEDVACSVKVWLGKLTMLSMTQLC